MRSFLFVLLVLAAPVTAQAPGPVLANQSSCNLTFVGVDVRGRSWSQNWKPAETAPIDAARLVGAIAVRTDCEAPRALP